MVRNELRASRRPGVHWRRQTRLTSYTRYSAYLLLLPSLLAGCSTGESLTREDAISFEKRMQVQAAFAEAALMQQSGIKLVAPDVQDQLQSLAADVAVRSGVDMTFRVHITNDPYVGTFSLASGDIFLPTGYLNMVENRDEIAFGLAREIAIQHRLLPLRDLEARYIERQQQEMAAEVFGIVTSAVIHGVYYHYVTGPIHESIMKQIKLPVQTILVEDSSGKIGTTVSPSTYMQYRQVGNAVSGLISPLGWIPGMATSVSLKVMSRLITVASEEADAERRKQKNDLGLAYMEMAGYSSAAGENVVRKLEQFWEEHESNK